VLTSAVDEPSVVQRTVERTVWCVAGMRDPSASENEKPALAGAGDNVRFEVHPV